MISTLAYSDWHRALLAAELILVFVFGPLVVWKGWWPARLKIVLLLIVALLTAGIALIGGATPEQIGIGDNARTLACLKTGVGLWAIAQLILAAVHLRMGRWVFPFIREQPRLFGILCIVYTLSVTAQEFLFRSYFFWRYAPLGTLGLLLVINVLAFGWIHIVFNSWISVALTLVGGIFFASLYLQYHSLLGVSVAHLLCGLTVFAMGYGRYFYGGSDALARRLQLVDEGELANRTPNRV